MIDVSRSGHYVGDARSLLREMPDGCVQTCVTSSPYYGLRDYRVAGQIGLEATPRAFVSKIVAVFREVRRVLRKDGTLWLNLGDTYTGSRAGPQGQSGEMSDRSKLKQESRVRGATLHVDGLAYKNLIGIPWRVAFALQKDGWILRSDIIWHKPNAMPSSVLDRVTPSHEYVFMLSKSRRYYFDADAIAEPAVSCKPAGNGFKRSSNIVRVNADGSPRGNDEPWTDIGGTRNARDVWTIPVERHSVDHDAIMPTRLAERCILAGAPPRWTRARSVLWLGHDRRGSGEARPALDRLRHQPSVRSASEAADRADVAVARRKRR